MSTRLNLLFSIATLVLAACGGGATSAEDMLVELVRTDPDPPTASVVEITVRIADTAGNPLDDRIQSVEVVAEMAGMPDHTTQGTLNALGDGLYGGPADVSAFAGSWDLRLVIRLDDGTTREEIFQITVQY